MLINIKNVLNKHPITFRFFIYYYWWVKLYAKLLAKVLLFRFPVDKRFLRGRQPTVLQLPITYKCNLDCIMCGMSSMRGKEDFSLEELSELLQNKLFKNIKNVGVNGGEPFLIPNLEQYIDLLIKHLPKLENIYIITNGYFTDNIINTLEIIKGNCSAVGVKLTVSVSIDGINETHDFIRGKAGVFKRAEKTCLAIIADQKKYCDEFGVICTITKHNIYNINEVDVWAKDNQIDISYNVATLHMRLFNAIKFDDFSIFADEHTKMMAAEWFFSKFYDTKSSLYFALYKYVSDMKRKTGCNFKYDGVTVTSEGNISYCATCSNVIGNGLKGNAYQLYHEKADYRNRLINDACASCSHYAGTLTFKAILEYNREILRIIGNPFMYH